MKIPSMGGETSSMVKVPSLDVIHGWRNLIHGWRSVICGLSSMDVEMSSMDDSSIHGYYPWMTSTDGDDRWRTWTEHKAVRYYLVDKKALELTWAIMAHACVITSYQSPCGIGLKYQKFLTLPLKKSSFAMGYTVAIVVVVVIKNPNSQASISHGKNTADIFIVNFNLFMMCAFLTVLWSPK